MRHADGLAFQVADRPDFPGADELVAADMDAPEQRNR
jgi:hypothetical protein